LVEETPILCYDKESSSSHDSNCGFLEDSLQYGLVSICPLRLIQLT